MAINFAMYAKYCNKLYKVLNPFRIFSGEEVRHKIHEFTTFSGELRDFAVFTAVFMWYSQFEMEYFSARSSCLHM